MEILKNNISLIPSINAKLSVFDGGRYTHLLIIKCSIKEENKAGYELNNLIQCVFDLVSDDAPLTDNYTLSSHSNDARGDSGGGYSYSIDAIETGTVRTPEYLDSQHFEIVFKVTLSNFKGESY